MPGVTFKGEKHEFMQLVWRKQFEIVIKKTSFKTGLSFGVNELLN